MFELFLSEGVLCYDGRTSREVKNKIFTQHESNMRAGDERPPTSRCPSAAGHVKTGGVHRGEEENLN